MKIDGSRYEHEPIPGKKLSGMLLRISFGIWNIGYADLHPWPSLGDAPLDEQIDLLLQGELTPMLQKSFFFAGYDAKARRQNRNLLHGLNLPSSHGLFGVSPISEKFAAWKIKMKAGVKTDLSKLPSGVRLRLDFNGELTYSEFSQWWKTLSPTIKNAIDVIEDPYKTGEAHSDLGFYSDWIENPSWPGTVFKPARDRARRVYQLHRYRKVMFTHSLNHPLGQVAALWEAARFYKKYPTLMQAGGFTKVNSPAFKSFNDVWNWQGSQPKPAPGLGFGFDQQLEALKWERLL